MILALDLGTHCGWARSGVTTTWGTWNLTQGRYAGGGMRYLRFEQLLLPILYAAEEFAPKLVAFEEVRRHMGVDAAHVYGGLLAILTKMCDGVTPTIPYQGYPVGTIKKLATGKGNADKAKMLAAARARWGPTVEDDNQADALWTLALAESEYGSPASQICPERKALHSEVVVGAVDARPETSGAGTRPRRSTR